MTLCHGKKYVLSVIISVILSLQLTVTTSLLTPSHHHRPTFKTTTFHTLTKAWKNPCSNNENHHRITTYTQIIPPTHTKLFQSNNDNDNNNVIDRFLSPIIDDRGLPLADTLIAQIVAPTLQVFWLSANHAPRPTWLQPYFASSATQNLFQLAPARGSLVAPTLIHGAGLACCWILGALASEGFQSDAFNISGGRGYKTVLSRLLRAGSFATGVLILSTQLDLLREYGGQYVQFGQSDETDVRLLSALVEVINDVFFEGIVLGSWRIYRASLTGDPSGRPPNYKP
eukprot:CAMPEP_0184867178 /NCGR_PEP_ID=MMETSP0580-20130426/25302_1 /TAXON_ID=1118495 /ORGANISM="Dactyliosolen fragilissimus" /LENGTH=284 /DNA_ID=CAMNT_0027367271 /DNA_START=66 /DNA_END=920 /DNA_ORIENTATION=+